MGITIMRHVAVVFSFVLAMLAVGCGPDERRALIPFGEAAQERRLAFCQMVAKVMKDYDDMYGPHIKVEAESSSNGRPMVMVHCSEIAAAGQVGRAVAVAVTNFSLQYPGIGFMEVDDNTWKIILPDEMKIEEKGPFRLHIP